MRAHFLVAGAAFALAIQAIAFGQSAISISPGSDGKYKTYLAGEISISVDIPSIDTRLFTCTPLQPFKAGDKIAMMMSEDDAWSVETRSFPKAATDLEYPVIGMVKASDGFHSIIPVLFVTKLDLKPGAPMEVDGYQVSVSRTIRAGESIRALRVGDSVLSFEKTIGGAVAPVVTAYKIGTKPQDRTGLLEAWRLAVQHKASS